MLYPAVAKIIRTRQPLGGRFDKHDNTATTRVRALGPDGDSCEKSRHCKNGNFSLASTRNTSRLDDITSTLDQSFPLFEGSVGQRIQAKTMLNANLGDGTLLPWRLASARSCRCDGRWL